MQQMYYRNLHQTISCDIVKHAAYPKVSLDRYSIWT